MKIQPGLNKIGMLDVEATRPLLEQAGYATFVLSGKGILDSASFFEAARRTFPLDPPLIGSCNWDALADSLWEGLHTHSAKRIAILWPNTQPMASRTPADFEIAVSVLTDVSNSLADPQFTNNNPKEIAVLLQ